MPSWLPIQDWRDVLDIALVAMLGWLAIRAFRRTRAQAGLVGLALLGAVYLGARALDLRLAASLLQAFFAVVVLVLVVVFQDELRRFFEQLGSWRRGRPAVPEDSETVDLLVRTVARLAASRTGALIVLPGREPLDRHVEGGVAIGARVSEPLLLSIFDASSPGHDGAVILRDATVERFAVHLPLSANHAALGPGGTRHAAGLGLAERSDAVCIIVSEERGTVSVAREGEIRTLSRPEDLVGALREARPGDAEARHWWRGGVGRDAALAAAGSILLWMIVVPGSTIDEVAVAAAVDVTNLPGDRRLESVEPDRVEVTLRGTRRDLLLAQQTGVTVEVDAYLARLGRRTFAISPQDVRAADNLSVVSLDPTKVRLSLAAPATERPDRP